MTTPAPRGAALLIAALAAFGPFSIDTYLPSFHAIGDELAVSPLAVQQTLTAFLLPFAFMMLWHGALSDALGRRRVVLWGVGIYALASLVCAFAPSIEWLWAGRAFQGLSAGAGMVVGRAIIRDLFDGPAAQRLMAKVGMLFAVAPAVAPVLGGWLHATLGWRGIFLFLTGLGVVIGIACLWALPETLPPARRQSLALKSLWRGYRHVLGSREFMLLSLGLGFAFCGFFLYVLSAPTFLMRHLGVSERGFLWLFGPSVIGILIGNRWADRLAGKLSPSRSIRRGFIIMLTAAAFNVILNLLCPPSLPWTVLPIVLYNVGMVLSTVGLQLLGLDLFPERRGMAASCQSVIHSSISIVIAAVGAPLLWGSTLGLAMGMAVLAGASLVAFRLTRAARQP